MNELVKVYNDGSVELRVEFRMIDGQVYAKANTMAEPQKLADWKRSANTKRYLEALKSRKINGMENSHSSYIISESGTDTLNGTWIHEKLILNLARYISVDFEIWADEQIATLIRERVQVKSILNALENIEFNGNMDNLVYSKNGKPITTSKIIAEYTGKEHKNILRDIKEEIDKLKNIGSNLSQSNISSITNDFVKTEYLDSYGRSQVEYELGEMATMQLMLKYSVEHRAKFILMFYKMKETLMNMFKVKLLEDVLPQDNRLRQYVYIIKNNDTNRIKVGIAQNVEKRLKQLQTGSDSELVLVYRSMVCSNAFEIEKFMHNNFKDNHVRGEWFNVSELEVINELEKCRYVLKSELIDNMNLTQTFHDDMQELREGN